MQTSFAPFGQVLRRLFLFKPSQSREPLPSHCCSRALSRDSAPLKLAYLLAHTSKWGVLEHSRILTPWATHSSWPFTLMTPSPRGWEAFPTLGALTHTRITWAFSPPAPQVMGVTPGSPLCPWCFGHPLWRCARHSLIPSPNHIPIKYKVLIKKRIQITPTYLICYC
jgi:hypothetical protein